MKTFGVAPPSPLAPTPQYVVLCRSVCYKTCECIPNLLDAHIFRQLI